MWTTADDIYISFLDGVRRTSQSVIKKSVFTRVWNEWALPQWTKINLSGVEGVELTEKQIEDLQSLIIHTDGIVYNPITPSSTNIYDLPDGTIYPSYKRVLRVWFRFSTTGDWIKSYPLRSIDESFVLNSKYSAPSLTLLYHRMRSDKIQAVTPVGYSTTEMNLMYVKEPNLIVYTAPDTITYTIDFKQEQLEEIRDISVRIYLERAKDPRWQSFIQEEMLKSIIQK